MVKLDFKKEVLTCEMKLIDVAHLEIFYNPPIFGAEVKVNSIEVIPANYLNKLITNEQKRFTTREQEYLNFDVSIAEIKEIKQAKDQETVEPQEEYQIQEAIRATLV